MVGSLFYRESQNHSMGKLTVVTPLPIFRHNYFPVNQFVCDCGEVIIDQLINREFVELSDVINKFQGQF